MRSPSPSRTVRCRRSRPRETAYLAARLGDRSLAYDAFASAYDAGQIDGRQLIDAAYAARRDYQNDDAIAWLKRAIDEADAGTLPLSPEELYGLRREVADISRRWGANIGLFYGSSGIGNGYLTPPASAGRTMQLGTEFYWRPEAFGYRDGRTVDFFVRQFTTLYDSLDGAIGASTMQGAAGVRVKPFTNLNFIVEAAQYFKIGQDSRNDFLLRAAISGGFNNDLMPWKDQWWTGQYYGEAGSYLVSGENFWDATCQPRPQLSPRRRRRQAGGDALSRHLGGLRQPGCHRLRAWRRPGREFPLLVP